jgi:hypothetical protein
MHLKLTTFPLAAVAAAVLTAPAQAQHTLYNQVLQLDGSGDYVEVVAASAPVFTTQLTAEAWIKTSVASGDQAIIARYNNSINTPINNSDDSFQLTVHDGKARFQFASGNTFRILDGSTFVADGNWHHVAGVYTGTTMRLVVDGVADGSQAASGRLNTPAGTNLRIGAAYKDGPSGFFFNGEIDDVRLWDAPMATADIARNRSLPLRDRSGSYPIRESWRFNGPADTGRGLFAGNAQITPPIVPVPVLKDSYLRLDGDQEYVSLRGSTGLTSPTGLTVEAWIRPLGIGGLQSVVSKFCHNSGSLTDDAYFLGLEANGVPRFQISVGGNWLLVNGPTNLFDNRWHHLAGVYDGSQLRLYVDGVLRASGSLSGSIPSNTTSVYIGASLESASRTVADFFDGYIDDVRIWNYALSQNEIQIRKNSCWVDLLPGLMARYIFEGDFLNRVNMDASQRFWGQPAGAAERMTFVGSRSFGQGTCQ